MRILLVRHGESEGNVNRNVYFDKPDHAIELSPLGVAQAHECGRMLKERRYWPQRIWVSPYARTRQTAQHIIAGLGELPYSEPIEPGVYYKTPKEPEPYDVRESIHLVEQQFGLFDGYDEAVLPEVFPKEHAHYAKAQEFEGRFWARMPLGESRFDVCQRVHQFFGTIRRDAEKHGIKDIMVVSHGVTIRAFIMMWMHKPWEWFEEEQNPKNCEVRVINKGSYEGVLLTPNVVTKENEKTE